MSYYPFILVGLVAFGLIVRALGASASRATAAATAPIVDQVGGPNLTAWRAAFAKSLASKGARISKVSEPVDAVMATRDSTLQRDIVILVERDVFEANADGLEDRLAKFARQERPHSFRYNGQCAVCLVVGGPGAVSALPQARLRHGIGWYVVVTAFDTATNKGAEMPSTVQAGKVLSVPILTGMQEAVTALALAGGESSDENKTCPDCAEQVRSAARKCRFCGFQFPDPSTQSRGPEVPEPMDVADAGASEDAALEATVVAESPFAVQRDGESGRAESVTGAESNPPPGETQRATPAPSEDPKLNVVEILIGVALLVFVVGAVAAGLFPKTPGPALGPRADLLPRTPGTDVPSERTHTSVVWPGRDSGRRGMTPSDRRVLKTLCRNTPAARKLRRSATNLCECVVAMVEAEVPSEFFGKVEPPDEQRDAYGAIVVEAGDLCEKSLKAAGRTQNAGDSAETTSTTRPRGRSSDE